jgi:hypothetical protein
MSVFGLKSSRPENLTPFASQVYDTLAKYTAFPWPIMMAQCRRAGLNPVTLTPGELEAVVEFMAEAVARFTSPDKGAAVLAEMRSLHGPLHGKGQR